MFVPEKNMSQSETHQKNSANSTLVHGLPLVVLLMIIALSVTMVGCQSPEVEQQTTDDIFKIEQPVAEPAALDTSCFSEHFAQPSAEVVNHAGETAALMFQLSSTEFSASNVEVKLDGITVSSRHDQELGQVFITELGFSESSVEVTYCLTNNEENVPLNPTPPG